MATKIDCPVPSSRGEVFVEPTTNVIYTWVGTPPTNGYWSAFAGEDSDKLDDFFVKVAGDNMTGNLTLGAEGSPVITLNESNGSATFAGDITAGDTTFASEVVQVRSGGQVIVRNDGTAPAVWQVYNGGTSIANITSQSDYEGSA